MRITEYKTDNSITEIAFLAYPIAVNTDYDFRITDARNTIQLYMMGSARPPVEGSTSFRAAAKISICNRDFSIGRSELDFITVVLVRFDDFRRLLSLSISPSAISVLH